MELIGHLFCLVHHMVKLHWAKTLGRTACSKTTCSGIRMGLFQAGYNGDINLGWGLSPLPCLMQALRCKEHCVVLRNKKELASTGVGDLSRFLFVSVQHPSSQWVVTRANYTLSTRLFTAVVSCWLTRVLIALPDIPEFVHFVQGRGDSVKVIESSSGGENYPHPSP